MILLSDASSSSILPRSCLMQTFTLWGSKQVNALHSSAEQKVLTDCPSGQAGGSGLSGSSGWEGVVEVDVVSGGVVEVDVVSGRVVEVDVAEKNCIRRYTWSTLETKCKIEIKC